MHASWKFGSESQASKINVFSKIIKKVIAPRALATPWKSGSGSQDSEIDFLNKWINKKCQLSGLWPNLVNLALEAKALKLMFLIGKSIRKR